MKHLILQYLKDKPVVGWPKPLSLSDYQNAISDYLSALPNGEVNTVLQIGGVSHPGISDIDLVVVLNRGVQSAFKKYRVNIAGDIYRSVFIHDPWVIDHDLLPKLGLIFPFFKGHPVFGELELPTANLVKCNNKELALLHLSDSLLTKIPRELIFHLLNVRQVNAKFALVLVNSVRHSITLIEEAQGGAWGESKGFEKRISTLRTESLEGYHDPELLRSIIADSIDLSFKLIQLTQKLWDNMLIASKVTTCVYSGYFHTLIKPEYSTVDALNWSLSTKGRVFRSMLMPSWAAYHLNLLAEWHGEFSKHIRSKGIKPLPMTVPEGLSIAAKEMSRAKSDYISFGKMKLNYAGSLGITHGAGETCTLQSVRSVLKLIRCLRRSG